MKTTKSCNNNIEKTTFDCQYCNKKLATQCGLTKHILSCRAKELYLSSLQLKEEVASNQTKLQTDIEQHKLNYESQLKLELLRQAESYEEQLAQQAESYEEQLQQQAVSYKNQLQQQEYEHTKFSQIHDKLVFEYSEIKKIHLLELEFYKSQLGKYEASIKYLQDKLATPNVNNNVNLSDCITPAYIQIQIKKYLSKDIMLQGMKGLAKFAYDYILKDKNGNNTYVCTDVSRQIFRYKDTFGLILKDLKATKLVELLGPAITNRYYELCDASKQELDNVINCLAVTDDEKEHTSLEFCRMKLKAQHNLMLSLNTEVKNICNSNQFSRELAKISC